MSPTDDCLKASFFSGCSIDITALVCSKHEHAVFICAASFGDSQKPRPQPPRITSNVKFNLQFLRRIKEGRSGERPSTGYCRKKVERDPSIVAEEEEKREFYDSNSFIEIEMRRPVLLVDGYNMCGYWSKLKKHFKKGDLEYARQILVDELVGFSALRGTKAVVVFDAADSGLPDHKESYLGSQDCKFLASNVWPEVFSASVTADTWIEREGAFVWSCKFLVAAIKDAKKERDEIVREMTCYSTKGKLLEHNLNPEKPVGQD
ncbi:hypothetical protein GOP47_0010107 [Adiantum capillus-veneris]|uniref:YacP-like NYN domain protein n=1 Tax=Adiantum capillus-veneris TaxID=13818 RepID=A0A9D4UUH0_ADICA|nr:hypothetical protein GOP47_0010107 [Adiantum capillus-veneris]